MPCILHTINFSGEKRSENELNDVTWQRGVYTHHVTAQLTDEQTISDFLNSFRQARAEPTSVWTRFAAILQNVSKRVCVRLLRRKLLKTRIDISTSESESVQMAQPVKPILAKAMPTKEKWQKKSDIPESSATASSSTASASKSAVNPAKEDRRKPVKGSANKRETSVRAKELFKDANAAKEVYSKFKQEFTEIQWFQRPEGPQCCKNFEDMWSR